jgi:triacylglycerol lipase
VGISSTSKDFMAPRGFEIREDEAAADIQIWKEALFGADLLLLHASPVYYGLGIPKGDGSAVVLVPGFLGSDFYLTHLHRWLNRIGYKAYLSGIGINAECPNLLIRHRLSQTIEQALQETGRKIHLVGHSLGGVISRSVAAQQPHAIASVITLGAPFRGTVVHHSVLRAAKAVRKHILKSHPESVLPTCYTARCTCDFLQCLRCEFPKVVMQTAIYTKDDGIVDWHYCRTGKPSCDFEVPGTHIGMAFNASAYTIIAKRLEKASQRSKRQKSTSHRQAASDRRDIVRIQL